MTTRHPVPALRPLLEEWDRAMHAENKAANTRRNYRIGVTAYLDFCRAETLPEVLDRAAVTTWTHKLLGSGADSTARIRQQAVKRFSAWLAEEGIVEPDTLAGLSPPQVHEKTVPALSDDQSIALIKACSGRSFADRRDEAIVRLLLETMLRAGELVAMNRADLNLTAGTAVIPRTKTRRPKLVGFGPATARALDRYLRLRAQHRSAGDAALWLSQRRGRLSYEGLRRIMQDRAAAAGIAGFHPHLTRHTAASNWILRGGSEGGLQTAAGWSSRAMVERYTRSVAGRQAVEEARRLGLGEW